MLSNSDITEIVAILKKSAFVSEEDLNNVIIGVSLEAVQGVLESYLDRDIEPLEPSEELRRLDNVIDILLNTISLRKYRPISHSEYVSATKYAIDLLCKRRIQRALEDISVLTAELSLIRRSNYGYSD